MVGPAGREIDHADAWYWSWGESSFMVLSPYHHPRLGGAASTLGPTEALPIQPKKSRVSNTLFHWCMLAGFAPTRVVQASL
jgi:hypothetical protein